MSHHSEALKRPSARSLELAEALTPEAAGTPLARERAGVLGVEPVSRTTAAALTFIAASTSARNAVEIGTGTGVSTLALLGGLAADGVLTSIDSEAEYQIAAREALKSAGVPQRRARLIAGQALDVLPKLTDGAYDLVLIDADPLEYVEYVDQAVRLLRSGGVLVLHHALWADQVADPDNEDDDPLIVREAVTAVQESEDFTSRVLLPFDDGLLVAVRA